MAKKQSNALSADSLKQVLWETLQGIRSKRIDPGAANSIASQSREIMRIVQTEIKIAEMTGGALKGFVGIQAPKKGVK
jgi:hypothetical protein